MAEAAGVPVQVFESDVEEGNHRPIVVDPFDRTSSKVLVA
jgi:hypothetical protein